MCFTGASMCSHGEALKSRVVQAVVCVLPWAILCGPVGGASGQSPLAQLKVIGVRKMTQTEHIKPVSENARVTYLVRFRLEVSGDQGVYLLTLGPTGAPPLGYALVRNAGKALWLDEVSGELQSKSPGVERLTNELGARWILLPASAAYEWEIEAECSREVQSRSVFIEEDIKGPPTELISPWYGVGRKRCL